MRTSHREIKKRINQIKYNISDEEFFSSKAFAAYLTDMAEAITRRYKRNIRVATFFDTSENAPIAYTNNKEININAGNYITMSFPNRGLKADSMIGLNAHEIGHILFTDFEQATTYFNSLKKGKLYPCLPKDLSPDEEDSLSALTKYLNSSDLKCIFGIQNIAKHLLNILEDGYIEERMCMIYTGKFAAGIYLNNLRYTEMIPPISEQLAKGNYKFCIFANLLIQYCRSGDINNKDNYDGDILNRFYNIVPIIDDAIYDEDMAQRLNAVNYIMLTIWDYIEEILVQENVGEKKQSISDENSSEELLKKLKNQIIAGADAPNGNGNPVTIPSIGNIKEKVKLFSEKREKIRQVYENETGRMKLEKTSAFDEGDEGKIEVNYTYKGAGYENAASDINRILSSIAKERISDELHQRLSEELEKETFSIRLGNAHKGIKIVINRIKTVSTPYIEKYEAVAPPLITISKQMQKRIKRIFKDSSYTGKDTGLLIGKRIEPRLLLDKECRFFSKNRVPLESKDLAVALLIDESGSMSSFDRTSYARAAGIIVYDFCRAMGIPLAVVGHTEDTQVELFVYTDFDSNDSMDRYRLMDISAREGNRDGAALRYIAERLIKQPEKNKLLMLISDGQPAGQGGYSGTAAEADLRGIKKEYTNKGIMFVAAAIGSDKENIERIYGNSFLDITELDKLPFLLVKKIEKEMKG